MRWERSCVRATCSAARVRRLTGSHGGAGDQPPEQRGERDARRGRSAARIRRRWRSRWSTSVSGWANCTARPGRPAVAGRSPSVRMRRWMPFTLARRGTSRLPLRGERARGGAHRQRHAAPSGTARCRWSHELLVAAHLVGARGEVAEGVQAPARASEAPCPGAAEDRREPLRAASRGCRDSRVVGAVAQLRVDLAVQLVGDEQVGERGGEHHRDRHRGGRDERDAPAEAHGGPRKT